LDLAVQPVLQREAQQSAFLLTACIWQPVLQQPDLLALVTDAYLTRLVARLTKRGHGTAPSKACWEQTHFR